jgi:hypothetical protein
MFDWDAENHRHRRAVDSARASAPGLPRDQLVPGALVTLSPNRCTGDRSFSHEIYEILASNEGHVLIKQAIGKPAEYFKGPHSIPIHEHEFYGADHFASVVAEQERDKIHLMSSAEGTKP